VAGEVEALNALVEGLQAACPGRVVGRSFRPMAQIPDEELLQGVLTVTLRGEFDWANYRGREAQLGTLQVILLGQLRVAENADRVTVEDAELAMANEIKAFLGSPLPSPVRSCLAPGYSQSGQMDYPYGWLAFECEVRA
jgi:hypothetical protein